jgi:hypothetical protein
MASTGDVPEHESVEGDKPEPKKLAPRPLEGGVVCLPSPGAHLNPPPSPQRSTRRGKRDRLAWVPVMQRLATRYGSRGLLAPEGRRNHTRRDRKPSGTFGTPGAGRF